MNQNWIVGMNQKRFLKMAILAQENIVEIREQYTRKKNYIKEASRIDSAHLTFDDHMKCLQLKEELKQFEARFKPFELVNSDQKILNCQIDLHGGLRKFEAATTFISQLSKIREGLKTGSIEPNFDKSEGGVHIVKVICGYGHHSTD
jgi:hypothetical protein